MVVDLQMVEVAILDEELQPVDRLLVPRPAHGEQCGQHNTSGYLGWSRQSRASLSTLAWYCGDCSMARAAASTPGPVSRCRSSV